MRMLYSANYTDTTVQLMENRRGVCSATEFLPLGMSLVRALRGTSRSIMGNILEQVLSCNPVHCCVQLTKVRKTVKRLEIILVTFDMEEIKICEGKVWIRP